MAFFIVGINVFGGMFLMFSVAQLLHPGALILAPLVINYLLRIPTSIVKDHEHFYLTWFSMRFYGPIPTRNIRSCSMSETLFDHWFSMKISYFFCVRRCIEINSYGDYFLYIAPMNFAKLETTILKDFKR